MRLDLFNEQIKKIGAEMAEAIGEKFDESHLLIETNGAKKIILVYCGNYISVELPIELCDDVVDYNIRRDGILSLN